MIANEIENVEVVCIDVGVFFVVFGKGAWSQIWVLVWFGVCFGCWEVGRYVRYCT